MKRMQLKTRKILFSVCVLFVSYSTSAQLQDAQSGDFIEYKRVGDISLKLEVIKPLFQSDSVLKPAMVFFFGGGWVEGKTKQFEPQAEYFAQRGMVCFLVDYRVESRHGTTPFDALMDAKSAMRFIKKNALQLGIDSTMIVASGGSAGGQLAAATALIEGYNDPNDDLTFSSKPKALVLFNPVIDNGPGNRTNQRIGDQFKDFSPLHNIKKGAPPTIIFQGTEDNFTPVATIAYYQLVMEYVGSRCELFLYDGQKHGFFNQNRSEEYFNKTIFEADRFLVSLELLDDDPLIEVRD